jgi:hypothetical protein
MIVVLICCLYLIGAIGFAWLARHYGDHLPLRDICIGEILISLFLWWGLMWVWLWQQIPNGFWYKQPFKKKALSFLVLCLLTATITGCDSSSVKTKDWDVKLNRLLTDRSFDKCNVVIEPNDKITFTLEKFKSEGQQVSEILKGVIAGGAVGVGI